MALKRRRFGRTGLDVSVVSFGTGDNAGLMVNGTPDQQLEAVRRALELGINYFDTSPDYGKGAAETNLGRALASLGASPIVATKVEIMPEDVADIEGAIARSLEASLRRLRLDSVDILMIHNPPRRVRDPAAAYWLPLTPADYLGPALRGLETARGSGLVRSFGFTCEGAEPSAVIEVLKSGAFDAVNVWYNLINPTACRRLPASVAFDRSYVDFGGIATEAARCDAGVAVIRALAGGALSAQVAEGGVTARHPLAGGGYTRNPQTFAPEAGRGRAFAFLEIPGRTLAQAAYAFALRDPAIATVVGGFSDLAQLEELTGPSIEQPLVNEDLARIEAVYERGFV